MLIVMHADSSPEAVARVEARISRAGVHSQRDRGRRPHRDRDHRQQGRDRSRPLPPARGGRGLHPGHRAVQAGLARGEARGHRRRRRGSADRRPRHRGDGRPLRGGERSADPVVRARRGRGRRQHPARRGLQAAHLAVRLPGPQGSGARAALEGARGDRPQGGDRGQGHRDAGGGGGERRPDPDRRAQHAELLPPRSGGRSAQARAAQARHERHHQGAPDGRGVHLVARATSRSSSASAASAPSRP